MEKYLDEAGLAKQVGEMEGKMLICHCRMGEACHGDVLLERLQCFRKRKAKPQAEEGPQMVMEDFEDGLPTKILEDGGGPAWEEGDYEGSSGWRGRGPPRRAVVMGRERDLSMTAEGCAHRDAGRGARGFFLEELAAISSAC